MKKFLLTLVLSAVLLITIQAQLENIQSSQITTKDGLSDNVVTCVLKDSRGFMWFGTRTGLCRYDGYNFTVYKNDGLDTNSISCNSIYSINEDHEGNLWIDTELGFNRFNRIEETFTRFMDIADKKGHVTMSLGHSGKIWVVDWYNKLWQFDMATQKGSLVKLEIGEPDSVLGERMSSVHEDKAGKLWVGTLGGGIYTYDLTKNNNLIAHYQHNPQDNNSLSNNTIHSLFEDSSGAIWCGTANGLNQLIHSQEGRNEVEFVRYIHEPANPYL